MNEPAALAKMLSPGMRRPYATRGGIIQIHVTRACDKACFGCTQGSNLGGKPVMITVEEFEEAVLSLKDYFGVVGVFGGNPCMHPKFPELCAILRKHIPKKRCGLWSNKLLGKGEHARKTFNPHASNFNVHLDQEAVDEFSRDWPEAYRVVKGHDTDSRHSPPFVAMLDVLPDEEIRWKLIANCDVNQEWSAMICSVPGKGLRAFFCEIAGAQAMLHADNPDWPDTGLKVEPGWWRRPMQDFAEQVRFHCHRCGVPLRRFGQFAVNGEFEEVSQTHAGIYKTKDKKRRIELVTMASAQAQTLQHMTAYIENSSATSKKAGTMGALWNSVARRALPAGVNDWLWNRRQSWSRHLHFLWGLRPVSRVQGIFGRLFKFVTKRRRR